MELNSLELARNIEHRFDWSFDVKENQKYKMTTTALGKKGNPYSCYFCVILLDKDGWETKRYIRWLNDFTNVEKNYDLIFNTNNVNKIIVGYRFNVETPVKSDLEILVKNPTLLELEIVGDEYIESYDDYDKFSVPLVNLTKDEEDLLEKKIVWIFGSGRSGTTWLAGILSKHEENFWWDEPYIGAHFEFFENYQSRGSGYFLSNSYKNSWYEWIRKLILSRTFSQVQSLTKNVIIKEPNSSKGSPFILECLPNSKLIFLVRDGRDVVDSHMDAIKPGSWNQDPYWQYQLATFGRIGTIRTMSEIWRDSIEATLRAYEKHDPKLRLLIKYEDLKTNTLSEAKKIINLVGMNLSDTQITELVEQSSFDKIPISKKGTGKFYRAASTGGWKANFNKEERDLMYSIMSETLKKFGYAT